MTLSTTRLQFKTEKQLFSLTGYTQVHFTFTLPGCVWKKIIDHILPTSVTLMDLFFIFQMQFFLITTRVILECNFR